MRTFIIWALLMTPMLTFAQTTEEGEAQKSTAIAGSPLEIELSLYGHSLFGDGVALMPGETTIGFGYDVAAKYRLGTIGLALSGGYWTTPYDATTNGIAISTQRLENLSAHYVMFGPYITTGSDKFSLEINPKAGIQRFYFPHVTATSTVNGTSGNRVSTRTDFDAGATLGLGLKAQYSISENISVHGMLNYMTTLGSEAFRYTYRGPNQTTINTEPLQGISFGGGLSMDIPGINPKQKSFAPTGLDVGLGAAINFLTGKGIDNLPGSTSAGYDASLNLNYRIGRSGISLKGGFWDNAYEVFPEARRPDISAHYVSVGPIIPVTPKASKLRIEAVPHAGIQRLYFPHIRSGSPRTTTNLEAGWSAGLTARAGFPINPLLDFIVSADYTSMLTDRGFGFSVVNSPNPSDNLTNRDLLQRFNIGAGIAYKLMTKVEEVAMTPEEIAKMISEKEDNTDEETPIEETDGTDIQIGDGENDQMEKDVENTTIEAPKDVETTTPEISNGSSTNDTDVSNPPSTTTPSNNTEITTPSTTYPTTPATTPTYTSPSTSTGTNTVYRVQFVALSKDAKVFNELKQYGTVILEYYSMKGLYRYMVGDSLTEQEGLELLETIRGNGWPKAFLVKYEDGKRTRVR